MSSTRAQESSPRLIRVGMTEAHGMADELSRQPPDGVEISFVEPSYEPRFRLIRSPIKGFLRHFHSPDHDVLEAVLSPIVTKNRWVFSAENLSAPSAFGLLGLPLPLPVRLAYLRRLFERDNFRRVMVWSEAGRRTFDRYADHLGDDVMRKVTVVYPAVRRAPDDAIRFSRGPIRLLFSGDFFRKGGANVIDAFERIQKTHPDVTLRVCCDERLDFNTADAGLKAEYLGRIRRNPGITFGRVKRDTLLTEILPETDVYLLPTYVEAFGFAVLEAMAFGLPVITTNHFALPEMIEHGVTGCLIDTSRYDCDRLFKGYVVNHVPPAFKADVTEQLHRHLVTLVGSPELRHAMGRAGVAIARSKFSIETRNARMREIYREAVAG